MRSVTSLRLVILALVIVLSISTVSLLILNIVLSNETEKTPKVDALVVGSTFTQEQYDAHTIFEVNNKAAFEALFPPFEKVDTKRRYNFSGKTVQLKTDITTSTFLHIFSGVFNGQGHSITIESNAYALNPNPNPLLVTDGPIGLFCGELKSGGIIQNARFLNCSAYCDSGSAFIDTHAGIIVGHNNGGVVENCIVENLKFESNRDESRCMVAPLVGRNDGTVKNCIVKGSYKIGGENDDWLADGLRAFHFVVSGKEAQNCISSASVSTFGETSSLTEPDEADTNAFDSIFGNYRTFTDAFNNFSSSIANSETVDYTAAKATPWFKYKKISSEAHRGYGGNSSIPIYLRAFVKFQTVSFSVATINGVSPGTVNPTSVKVPSEYTNVSINGESLKVYGISIIITATQPTKYEFDKWTSSGNSYTANFKIKDFTLEFYDDDATMYENSNLGQLKYKYGSNQYTTAEEASFTISTGSLITVSFLNSHSACAYKTSGDKYVAVKISFYGKLITNNKPETTGRNYEVVFVLTSPDYYIPSAYIEDEVVTSTTTYNASQDLSFFVDYVLRDYSLGII